MSAGGGYLLYVLFGVGAFATSVALAWLARRLYVGQVRRSLLAVLVRREAVRAAERGLRDVVASLAEAGDAQLVLFATGGSSEERRALEELASRMRIVADELGSMPLPKPLWQAATLVQDAAEAVLAEAAKVGAHGDLGTVIEGLSQIDLTQIEHSKRAADEEIERLPVGFRVDDPAVYGGGLYI